MSRRTIRFRPTLPDQQYRSIASARMPRRDVGPSEPQISSNDILNLKKELNSLTKEKSLLKAKIQRLSDALKENRPKITNQRAANNLMKEMRKIEQYNAGRRAEIATIMRSDLAAEISEQQQESLLLYQEINRINKRKKEADRELLEVNEQLEIVSQQFSAENLRIAQNKLADLEQEISLQEKRNERLRAQIEEADQERSKAEEASSENLQKQISILEQKIQEEQKSNQELDREIEETRKKYDEELQKLQKEL